jgi:hypothetical protein
MIQSAADAVLERWLPSQSGGEAVFLHTQNQTCPVVGALYCSGATPLPLCVPSQNGWVALRPQRHHQ